MARIRADLLWMLEYLHQGGSFGYWWTLEGKRSTWWPAGHPTTFTASDLKKNLYFGIHPVNEIPTTDEKGNPKPPESLRSKIELIAAVNCLFSEFDAKDFEGSKEKALAHIRELKRKPTDLIDSGGGYHGYWFLDETFYIRSEDDRKFIADLQARWVDYTGGDKAAKDLARVLRVPGTLNRKPEYNPPRKVVFLEVDRECIYSLEDLAALLPEPETVEKRIYPTRRGTGADERPGDEWAAATSWEEILEPHGWHIDHLEGEKIHWTRPGKKDGTSATVGYAGLDNLYVFTSNAQPLEPSTSYNKFSAYAALNHAGDYRAAAKALAALGFGKNGNEQHETPAEPEMPDDLPPAGADEYGHMAEIDDSKSDLNKQSEADYELQNAEIHLTDLGNARRFARQFGHLLRYTEAWGWMAWNGKHWERDDTGRAMRMAKRTVDQLYQDARAQLQEAQSAISRVERSDDKAGMTLEARKKLDDATARAKAFLDWAYKSESRSRIDAMLSAAGGQSEGLIPARTEDFDQDPWLLNVQNGILDLRTGNLSPHNPRAMMTKVTGTHYDPAATCPTWDAFLVRIFNGNQELIDFMQRAVGYSLTGSTREQVFFFLYGTGANGKSTFTGAIQTMMGEYARKTRAQTIMAKRNDALPEDVARLAGARFALAAELSEGMTLDEGLVKDLTGGDKMTARFLYQASFEFFPTLKLWMYGNHEPEIRGTDQGIWRRPKKIPFTVTIPDSEKDDKLPEKLQAELPGILAWAVRGCKSWQEIGLKTPAIVEGATQAYRAKQDRIGEFIDLCCVINDKASVTAGELYQAYKKTGGSLSQQKFSRAMEERGWTTKDATGTPVRDGAGRAIVRGLGLIYVPEGDNNG